jgi:hypothetical protein
MSNQMTVYVNGEQMEIDEWGLTDLDRMHAHQIKKFAAWSRGKYPMNDTEILLTALYARRMGVHPLDEKAFQAYKDARGIHCAYHYSIVVAWVRRYLKVRHTQPMYFRLSKEELKEAELGENDVAYWCTFILIEDLPHYYQLIDRVGKDEAYKIIAKRGLGSVSKSQWDGQYFAPNGRSKAWKVKKRALIDAYSMTFGNPSAEQARAIRQAEGWRDPDMQALESASFFVDGQNAVAIAQAEQARNEQPALEKDKMLDAQDALYGKPKEKEPVAVEGEIAERAIRELDVAPNDMSFPPDDDDPTDGGHIEIIALRRSTTSNDKEFMGFMLDGEKWPHNRVRMWSASKLVETCPEIAIIYTSEQLHELGKTWPFFCTVHHDGAEWPKVTSIEFNDAHRRDMASKMFEWARAKGVELPPYEYAPDNEWFSISVAVLRG